MALPSQTASLEVHDPEMHDLIEREKNRQWKSLELIASEVRVPSVLSRVFVFSRVRM